MVAECHHRILCSTLNVLSNLMVDDELQELDGSTAVLVVDVIGMPSGHLATRKRYDLSCIRANESPRILHIYMCIERDLRPS